MPDLESQLHALGVVHRPAARAVIHNLSTAGLVFVVLGTYVMVLVGEGTPAELFAAHGWTIFNGVAALSLVLLGTIPRLW